MKTFFFLFSCFERIFQFFLLLLLAAAWWSCLKPQYKRKGKSVPKTLGTEKWRNWKTENKWKRWGKWEIYIKSFREDFEKFLPHYSLAKDSRLWELWESEAYSRSWVENVWESFRRPTKTNTRKIYLSRTWGRRSCIFRLYHAMPFLPLKITLLLYYKKESLNQRLNIHRMPHYAGC